MREPREPLDPVLFKLRPFSRDRDLNFVLNSWLLSGRHCCPLGDLPDYFSRQEPALKRLLDRQGTQGLVVCNPDNEDQIFAWAISEGRVLHYVYTKHKWRHMGLASHLVAQLGPLEFTTCTAISRPGLEYIGVY